MKTKAYEENYGNRKAKRHLESIHHLKAKAYEENYGNRKAKRHLESIHHLKTKAYEENISVFDSFSILSVVVFFEVFLSCIFCLLFIIIIELNLLVILRLLFDCMIQKLKFVTAS